MKRNLGLVLLSLVWVLAILGFARTWPARADNAGSDRPPGVRLAVLVVFDQMRGDYLERWQDLFGPDGFRKMQHEGAWFTNCHYPYAYTMTAPGHASMVTGCSPDRHGIIGNDWYDRSAGMAVASITAPDRAGPGLGPQRRLQESVGDVLLRRRPGSRVVSLSIKDRAAILMAALRAWLCAWFDTSRGDFVTSRFYRDLPPWVSRYNRDRPADGWLKSQWDRLRPELDYEAYSGPDDAKGEGTKPFPTRTFPHVFPDPARARKGIRDYYETVTYSPAGNDLLLSFAKRAIVAEKLGQGAAPDLLLLSFSSNDLVGHVFGPDSQEVLDITLRSDRIVADLIGTLDSTLGRDHYVLVVCADHGVCPLPEHSTREGKDAGRVPLTPFTSGAERLLNVKYLKPGAKAPWLEATVTGYPWIYLNQATLREQGVALEDAEQTLADWLPTQPGIQAAYTRTQLLSNEKLDAVGASVRRSFHPDRSGNVLAVQKPYYLFETPLLPSSGTSHGTPHAYDTHVPLLVFGAGVQPGVRGTHVTPQAVAAILAHALDVPLPSSAEVSLPAGLFRR